MQVNWTTIPPAHKAQKQFHICLIFKSKYSCFQTFLDPCWTFMFLGKEDFLGGVNGEETVGQWISTYVTKGASGAAVITLSPGPRGQTWIFKSLLAKIHVWFCSLIMIFSYMLSRAVEVRKKEANYSWLRRMVLRRLGYRLEIYQVCVTSSILNTKGQLRLASPQGHFIN